MQGISEIVEELGFNVGAKYQSKKNVWNAATWKAYETEIRITESPS